MPQQGTIFRVLIASPNDCKEERPAIREAIHAWNATHSWPKAVILEPVMWETHSRPELGGRPQEILNKQIVERCDILVGVFRTRLGTHTGRAESGIVEEIGEFCSAGKPVLLYFASGQVDLERVDESQLGALREYRARIQKEGLFANYKDIADLKEQLQRHLSSLHILPGTGSEPVEVESISPESALDEVVRTVEQDEEDSIEPEMPTDKVEILKLLAQDNVQNLSAANIGEILSVPKQKAHYFLDQLHDEKYIGYAIRMGVGAIYNLASRGREYLIEHGHL